MGIINNTFLSNDFVIGYLKDLKDRNKKAYDDRVNSEKISINNKEYYIILFKNKSGDTEVDLEEIK